MTAFRDEVAEDALERGPVRLDLELGGDVDPNVRLGRGVGCDARDQLAQDERLRLDPDRLRVEPGQVEQLLDQAPEADGLLPQRVLELLAGLGCEHVALVLERRRDPVDRRRRRAQLVRRDRDEVELHLVEPDELVVDPRPLDRDRGSRGDELQQLLILGVEEARLERPNVEHSDHTVGRDQRHSEHALDALFAEDRVQDIRVVDIVEHDRACLGRDPACEAAADRDAHALLDLFLEPDGRPGDELVRRFVEHQHRGRVDLQHVSQPHEQLAHELVEAKACERRLHHGMNLFEPRPATALGFEQAGMLDCDGHAVGDDLEELDVVLRELAGRERADVEHAEHFVSEDEWDAGEALDALLVQDRVQHVRVVDVVEHDRPPLRRDPAREPAADGDPHAPFDLFLEPDRRARDELVPEVVAEEDRGRVGVEHVPDAREQLAQEVVQVQVRERGIRDELDPPQPLDVTRVAHGGKDRPLSG